MKLEDCKKCKYHVSFYYDEILCEFWHDIEAVPVYSNEDNNIYVASCPKDKPVSKAL